MAQAGEVPFEELVKRQRPDMSLEQPFYADSAVFEREMQELIPGQWLYVEHVTAIPDKGDYVLYDIAGESIIVVRGRDGGIRAFYNVCAIAAAASALRRRARCARSPAPNHAWVYDLEGKLIHASLIADDFDPGDWPLHTCQVRVWQGMIFINLVEAGQEVADFDDMATSLERYAAPYRLTDTKIIHQAIYPTDANWKPAVENFRECYHCSPGYSRIRIGEHGCAHDHS